MSFDQSVDPTSLLRRGEGEETAMQCKVKKKLKVACGAFSALQPVGRLYPCPQ